MTLPVFVCSALGGVVAGEPIALEGEEARHAAVKRVRVGERVALTDGVGTSAEVTVTRVGRAGLVGTVESLTRAEPLAPRIVVVQAIPKGDRSTAAIEMLTEVGADVIVPWAAERSVAVWRDERATRALAKWRTTAREAAKQARRSWFPVVADPASTNDVAALLRDAALSVVLHEEATRKLASLEVPATGEVAVVVGPEGGINSAELATFAEAGVEPVRLGSSVLRTSTAGVAAVAALLARTPRWR